MDGQMSKYEISGEARKALNRTRDQYAAAENIAGVLVGLVGDLPHMRDATARLVNYDQADITAASFAEGSERLAEALHHFQAGFAALQRAHNADVEILGGVKAGRPKVKRLREVAVRILEQTDGMVKFGR